MDGSDFPYSSHELDELYRAYREFKRESRLALLAIVNSDASVDTINQHVVPLERPDFERYLGAMPPEERVAFIRQTRAGYGFSYLANQSPLVAFLMNQFPSKRKVG